MTRTVKISLSIFIFLFAILILATGFVVTLDPNDHKEWLAEKFNQQTGRDLTLAGDIDLTLYPWLGLSFNQVSIGNRTGFDEAPLFLADNAHFRVKLLPMLRQHYELDTVQLYGARLNLTVNEEGVSNWGDLIANSDENTSATSESAQDLPLSDFVLGGVDIQNASIGLEDHSSGARYEINNLNFNTDELVYAAPIDLTLSMDVVSSNPQLSAEVLLNGTVNYDIDNGQYQLDPVTLQANLVGDNLPDGAAEITMTAALNLNLEDDTLVVSDLDLNVLDTQLLATINGSGLSSTPVYQSDMALTGSDLAVLFKAAEIEPLATQLQGLDDRTFELTISSTVDLAQNRVDISQLSANLLGSNLEGAFLVSNVQSEQLIARGNLNASGPDLPVVVEVLSQIVGGPDSPLSEIGRELRQVSDKAFSVSTEFDANLQTGNIIISTLEACLLDTSINGNLSASEVQTESPLVNGKLTAQGPDLPLLLQIAGLVQGGNESSLFQYGEKLSTVGDKSFIANTEFDADIAQGNIVIPDLAFSTLGLQLSGNIDAQNMTENNGTVSGTLNLEGSNLQQLLLAIEQPGLGDVLQRLSINVQLSGTRNNLFISPFQANLVVAGDEITNSPVTLEMNADTRLNLDQETMLVEIFSLSGLGLDVSGNVSANNLFETPAFEGQLEVASFNLRRLLQQLNQSIPVTVDDSVLQQLAINTDFSGSLNRIELSNLAMSIDESNLTGRFSVADTTNIATEFNLEIDQLDIDRYLPPESTQLEDNTNSTSTEIPRDLMSNLEAQGQFQANSLSVAGMNFTEMSLTLNAANGQLDIAPLSTNLYQGSFEGNIHLSVTDSVPFVSVESNLRQIDLEPLLQDLMDATYLTGNGNVQLAVTSSGADTDALIRNLNGNGRIELEEGVFTGVDVANVLGQVETMLRSRRVAEFQRGQQTAFDSFTGTIIINNGEVSTNDMLIMSPGFQVSGQGTLLDLNTDVIGFDLVTSVDAATATRDDQEYDIGGYSLPIACTGTLDSPRCLPDAGEIVRGVLAREVQRRVGGFLERAIGIEEPQPTEPAADDDQDPQTQQEPEPLNPTDELINRALNRIFN